MRCHNEFWETTKLSVAAIGTTILGEESKLSQMCAGIYVGKFEGMKLVRLLTPHHCGSGLMAKLMLPDMGLAMNMVKKRYMTNRLPCRSSSL